MAKTENEEKKTEIKLEIKKPEKVLLGSLKVGDFFEFNDSIFVVAETGDPMQCFRLANKEGQKSPLYESVKCAITNEVIFIKSIKFLIEY